MENSQTEQNKNNWFTDLSWKTALLIAGIGMLTGGTTGGVVATKGVQPVSGLTEEKADVRYLSKSEAERRIEERNRQIEAIDKKMVSREVFDAYHETDSQRLDRIEKNIQMILENQNRR